MADPATDASNTLIEMVRGYQLSQALAVAAELGIADRLAAGPLDCLALAQLTGTDATALYRLLRALASRGVFFEGPAGRFELNEAAMLLRSDVPGSMRAQIIMWCHPMQWGPWGRLLDSVRTGQPAFPLVYGKGFYEHLATHAEDAATFRAAMAASQSHDDITSGYDMSARRLIVDVGGGVGRLLAELLHANPGARGILLDRPQVVAESGAVLATAGVAERCRVVGGDFFADIPAGGDAYVLSSVLMDQDDDAAIRLLRACREAMAQDGRVVVIERVIPAPNVPSLAHLSNLMSLVISGGRNRSSGEFDQLFAAVGLRRGEVVELPSGYSVVEGLPG